MALFGSPTKSSFGGFFNLRIPSAPAAKPAAAPVATPSPTPAPVATPAPAPAPVLTGKAAEVAKYSAAPGTVINTGVVDALLKQNIDKGDPNIVTGSQLKSAEQKGQIDPSLGNLLSVNAAVAKGAAALGIQKNERSSTLGGVKEISYSGDLAGAAKSLGIDPNQFTKVVPGAMGTKQTVVNKEALYNAINDKANQIGLYSITEREPGKTGSASNAQHTTTFYQNTNGTLQPLKDKDGKPLTSSFKANTFYSDEGFFEGLVNGIKGIATEMAPIISAALPNLGLTAGALLGAQAAQAVLTGAKPIDVIKSIVGSVAAPQLPGALSDFTKAITDPTLKSTIENALVQAGYATITGKDVGTYAAAGAAGGAAADLAKSLVSDPNTAKALGGVVVNALTGAPATPSSVLAAASALGKAVDTKTAAQEQVIEAFSQPKTAGVGTQLGEATAGLDKTLATTPGRETVALPEGSSEAGIMLPPVTVEGVADKFPGAEVPASEIEAAMRIPSAQMPGGVSSTIISPTVDFGGTTRTPSISARDQQIIDLTGIRGKLFGEDTTKTPSTTSPATPSTTAKAGDKTLPEVTVIGEREEPSLPPVEVVGERETETKPTEEVVTKEELGSQEFPLTTPEEKTTTLAPGKTATKTKVTAKKAITPGEAALGQALRIGDPLAAYIGKKGRERKPVWNIESLKLKDELGG